MILAFCYMMKYERKTAIPGLKSRNGRPKVEHKQGDMVYGYTSDGEVRQCPNRAHIATFKITKLNAIIITSNPRFDRQHGVSG